MGGELFVELVARPQYLRKFALCLQAGWSTSGVQPIPSSRWTAVGCSATHMMQKNESVCQVESWLSRYMHMCPVTGTAPP